MSDPFVPLSVLGLDMPAPETGWAGFLADRDIPLMLDDLGRASVTRGAARDLLSEHRENEARKARKAQEIERQAIEADQLRRAQMPRGIPAGEIPPGLSPALAMVATDPDRTRPRRASVLDHALSHDEGIVFHPIHGEP